MKKIDVNDKEYLCDLQAPCFQALNKNAQKLIKESKTQVLFRKGDNLTKQGTFASYVLFVYSGLAVQYVEDDSNKSFNLHIIKPGEFIGLFSLFSKITFNYSSKALTDCHAFLVEKHTITSIISKNGDFGLGLFRRYSMQNIEIYETLRTVLFKQMNGRFAETLLYINSFKEEFPEIFQSMTRKEIADFAGISTESAVKLLKSLEKEKCIELNGKDIEITNREKLEEISKLG